MSNKKCSICGEMDILVKGMCHKCYCKDYYKLHKQDFANRMKIYSKLHREEIAAQQKEYREFHREEIANRREEYSKLYSESRPRFAFFEKRIPFKYRKKAPEGYVWHHTCYDHTDPEANMVLLLNSSHSMGHHLLKKLGIEIPYINMEK